MTTRTYHNDPHPPPEQRKAVLFCPECGYEGRLADDWEIATTGSDRLLVCPDCETVVDRRSRPRCECIGAA